MSRLTDPWFDAHFFYAAEDNGSYRMHHEDGTPTLFSEAQGVELWCPCGYGRPEFPLAGGRPHMVMVPFLNPPSGIRVPSNFGPQSRDKTKPRPRWVVAGSGIVNLTLSPSVAVGDPECWHGHIIGGEIR